MIFKNINLYYFLETDLIPESIYHVKTLINNNIAIKKALELYEQEALGFKK